MPRRRAASCRANAPETIAVGNRRAAAKAARLVEKLLDRADELREQGDDKASGFAARAAQSAAVAGGVSYDKGRLAEDRPTVIHGETRDADDILKSLSAMGLVIDGSAEEIASANRSLTRTCTKAREQCVLVAARDTFRRALEALQRASLRQPHLPEIA